jgi:hypothetical protein
VEVDQFTVMVGAEYVLVHVLEVFKLHGSVGAYPENDESTEYEQENKGKREDCFLLFIQFFHGVFLSR